MYSNYGAAASAYGKTQQHTASDLVALVELYDRILITMKKAAIARQAGRFDEENEAVQKIIRALTGLKARLNFKQGGSVAVTLENYYERLISQLRLKHKAADRQEFYESMDRQILVMRDTWAQLAGRSKLQRGTPVAGNDEPQPLPV